MLPTIRRNYNPLLLDLFDNDLFFGATKAATMPAANIKENEKCFNVELAVPGINKENLKIEINDDVLTISSEVKTENKEEKDGYKRKEFCFSSFCRSFYLPDNASIDEISASYNNGILNIEIPKEKEEIVNKNREIKIS